MAAKEAAPVPPSVGYACNVCGQGGHYVDACPERLKLWAEVLREHGEGASADGGALPSKRQLRRLVKAKQWEEARSRKVARKRAARAAAVSGPTAPTADPPLAAAIAANVVPADPSAAAPTTASNADAAATSEAAPRAGVAASQTGPAAGALTVEAAHRATLADGGLTTTTQSAGEAGSPASELAPPRVPQWRMAWEEVDRPPEALSNKQRRARALALTARGALRVVLDLSYADAMSEGELRSLKTQVKQAYAENLRQARPVQLTLTSVQGTIATVLSDITGFPDQWAATVHADHFATVLPLAEVVMLSPDAPDTLGALDPGNYYVVGGLVDRMGQLGVSLARARQLGVRVARLPLAEHVRIVRSNRLPINQVTSILAEVGATGDWAQALVRHIPKATRIAPP